MSEIKIIRIHNFFKRDSQETLMVPLWPKRKRSIAALRRKYFPLKVDPVISLNGQIIPAKHWAKSFPIPDDCLVFMPALTGGGDDWIFGRPLDVLRDVIDWDPALGRIQHATEDYARGNPWVVQLAAGIAGFWSFGLGSVAVYYIADRYGITGGAPDIKPPTIPNSPGTGFDGFDFGGMGEGWDRSQTYAWQPQTIQSQGVTVPKGYGTMKLYGNIIAGYTESTDDKNYLYSLLSLGLGPISALRDHKINDQPIANFTGVSVDTRLGLLNQAVIKNFNDTKTEYPASVKIPQATPYTYTTLGNDFDGLDVMLSFPEGLYHVNDGGDLENLGVEFKIEYRISGGDWATLIQTTVTEMKNSAVVRSYNQGDLPHGIYEVKITRITADHTTTRYASDLYFIGVREVYYDDFEYPRHVLVGIKALATDQLSGSLRYSCEADLSLIRVYDGANWTIAFNNNPAWVAYDILTQPVIKETAVEGGYTYEVVRYDGENPNRIDLTSFKNWADFCDGLVPDGIGGTEKRITFNGVFDNLQSLWDAVNQVCEIGRASLVIQGYKYRVIVDKAESPGQLFNVGNIIADSFKETFLSWDDRATEIEVDFVNSENSYERETFNVINPDLATAYKKSARTLMGITKPTEAWRAARYQLLCNQYLLRVIEIAIPLEALASQAGDVIAVQHDLPNWGYGGRLEAATSSTVTLDRTVTIEAGKSYVITVRLADDTMVTKNVTDAAGSYTVLHVSVPFATTPEKYDVYAFGEVDIEKKPFRITRIRRGDGFNVVIEAIEYNASIYNVDTDQPVLPTPDYSSLELLPPVTNITLDEIIVKGQDGALRDNIDVYWIRPNNFLFDHAEIWYLHNDEGSWQYAGISRTGKFRIQNVQMYYDFTVAVATVNTAGQKLTPDASPQATIHTIGLADPPSDVTVFRAFQNGEFVNFTWDHIEDGDLWGYEIRGPVDAAVGWDATRVIATGISANNFTWQAEKNGTYRFYIKAIDTSNIYSTNALSVDITLRNIDETLNILIEQDEITDHPELATNGNSEAGVMSIGSTPNTFVDCTFAQSTTQKHAGSNSSLMTGAGGGGNTVIYMGSIADFLPGHSYQASIWIYNDDFATGVEFYAYDNGGLIGNYTSTTTKDGWVKLSIAFTVGGGATGAGVLVNAWPNASGAKCYLDDLHVREIPDGAITNMIFEETQPGLWVDDPETLATYYSLAIDTSREDVKTVRITEEHDAYDPDATPDSYPARTNLSYPNDTNLHVTMQMGEVGLRLVYKLDGGASWIPYDGVFKANFTEINFGVQIQLGSPSSVCVITSLAIIIDVPDIVFTINGFSVSASGEDVLFSTYSRVFYIVPSLAVSVVGTGTTLKVPVITGKTVTGFHIDLLDIANEGVAGTVDIHVRGY